MEYDYYLGSEIYYDVSRFLLKEVKATEQRMILIEFQNRFAAEENCQQHLFRVSTQAQLRFRNKGHNRKIYERIGIP